MFDIKLKTTKETEKMLKDFPNDVKEALFDAMIKASEFLEIETKKSFGSFGYPKVRTGKLKDSIYHKTTKRASNFMSIIGTDVEYGRYLEEGDYEFLLPTVLRNEDILREMILDFNARELNK